MAVLGGDDFCLGTVAAAGGWKYVCWGKRGPWNFTNPGRGGGPSSGHSRETVRAGKGKRWRVKRLEPKS